MAKTLLKTDTGQSLMECLAALPFVLFLMTSLFMVVYLLLIFQWGRHWVYRSSVCLAQDNPRIYCQQQLEKRLVLFMPTAWIQIEELWKSKNKVKTQILLRIPPHIQHRLHSEIDLPLITREDFF